MLDNTNCDPDYKNVPNKGQPFKENGTIVHWNFGMPYPQCLDTENYGDVTPLEKRIIVVNGHRHEILKWETTD